METFATENPWLLAALFGLLGLILGLVIMNLWQRKQAGGQSVDQLRQEMDDYREKVSEHFATTSDLFRDMTEKYRDVYNHLANASQDLCEAPMDRGQLEFTERNQLSDNDSNNNDPKPEGLDKDPSDESPSTAARQRAQDQQAEPAPVKERVVAGKNEPALEKKSSGPIIKDDVETVTPSA